MYILTCITVGVLIHTKPLFTKMLSTIGVKTNIGTVCIAYWYILMCLSWV